MKKVLVISGHTDLATSVANKTILDTIGQYLPETEIVKLDTLYHWKSLILKLALSVTLISLPAVVVLMANAILTVSYVINLSFLN